MIDGKLSSYKRIKQIPAQYSGNAQNCNVIGPVRFPTWYTLKQGTQLLVAQSVRSRALNTGGPLYVP